MNLLVPLGALNRVREMHDNKLESCDIVRKHKTLLIPQYSTHQMLSLMQMRCN